MQHLDFETAARHLIDFIIPGVQDLQAGYLLQLLLSSLGVFKGRPLEQFRKEHETLLVGPTRDLAKMFLEETEPVPGPLWPHFGIVDSLYLH